jgi:hypothetical protein
VTLEVSNDGLFGRNILGDQAYCIPGLPLKGAGYPAGSHGIYSCWGIFWIGAVVGRDTLVSTGMDGRSVTSWELNPDESPFGEMTYRSIIDPAAPEYHGALSEQDFIAVYADTLVFPVSWWNPLDYLDHRPHRPLHIEVTQKSFAWSYAYAEDFILFDYSIKNIGTERLWDVYMGIYVDGDVFQWWREGDAQIPGSTDDDLCGFLREHRTSYGGCDWIDTVNLAWYADNDGDFLIADDLIEPVPHIAGIRVIRTPADSLDLSFNWWAGNYNPALDWGPHTKKRVRDLQTGGLGTPDGDRNKYHYLRNGEFDYDQIYTAGIPPTDPVWLYPNQSIARDLSDGRDSRFLLSFGRFSLEPGQALPISFAFVMGKNFHKHPYNGQDNLIDHYHPERYYENVDFSDIVENAIWASWVYDNPGFDTDGDGYAGRFRVCCADSAISSIDTSVYPPDTIWDYEKCEKVWYEGDGVPDFRGAGPPPAPKVWLEPEIGRILVRWNGTFSETTKDIFLQKIDFEGYRVYYSLDARESSYTLLASYDREDFDKHVWDPDRRLWEITDIPLSLEQCRCLYGDSCNDPYFDPLSYTSTSPYVLPGLPDSIFYFAPHDFNRSEFGVTTPIRKVYPDQPYPSTLILDSAEASELTEEGYFKYYEYEFVIENILPTLPYYVSVTAFDFGSPKSGLMALETSKTLDPLITYPLPDANDVLERGLKVYVYPNPYRSDGNYLQKGYEGRDARWYIPDRLRRIHFANLPAKCTISIFTLDGDLIRRLEHDKDPSDPAASHDTWDLISRNTQAVVSGIYYWTVEDEFGDVQIGKLVIIK